MSAGFSGRTSAALWKSATAIADNFSTLSAIRALNAASSNGVTRSSCNSRISGNADAEGTSRRCRWSSVCYSRKKRRMCVINLPKKSSSRAMDARKSGSVHFSCMKRFARIPQLLETANAFFASMT